MKKVISLVSFLSIFSTLSFAQGIVQNGKEWSFEYNTSPGESSTLIYFIEDAIYKEDTSTEFIVYKGLYSSPNKD